jgi:ATP-dependent Lhr-like helicase
MKDVLTEAMDLEGLKELLRRMEDGRIRCVAVDTPVPSQFSHEILNANPYAYLDDAPLEERRARAVEMRRILPESVLQEVGRLDPAAIAQVREEAWPDLRDADELHDVLLTFVALPEDVNRIRSAFGWGTLPDENRWQAYFQQLQAENRVYVAEVGDSGLARRYWVAAERSKSFVAMFPETRFENQPASPQSAPSRDDVLLSAMTGWMQHVGPTTATQLGDLLGVSVSDVDKALLRLESTGAILRGKFTDTASRVGAPASSEEWCDRRLLARIHRLTLGTLRKQIEPVTAAQFMRWLLRWQHVVPGTQVLGERGTLEILNQLQGFEIPANSWERHILARRIADYDSKILDQLCLTGAVGWGRLSPHPATLLDTAEGKRRVIPTSVAPITFFVRENSDWMTPRHPGTELPEEARGLSANGKDVLNFLRHRGASFFADIVRGTGKLKSEIETALWELVAAGIVTADGFDNLRSLIDPKRRSGQGHGRIARPRHSAGRWSLLYTDATEDKMKSVEATCWMLLKRYGVVFRDLLARETILPKWRELQIAFRRLEDRGEIRGGRFVDGFLGEQYALPVAVESLRASKKMEPTGETLTLSAADPLNLVGILIPGDRVPAISGKMVLLRDGVAVQSQDTYRAAGD